MARDVVVSAYLLGFKVLFNLFNRLSLKNKVTFVVSFGQDSSYIYREIRKQNASVDVVFLHKKVCTGDLRNLDGADLVAFETLNVAAMIKSVYHLATSRYVVVDNYFGFLSVVDFRDEVECIQLWHAAGAFKKFGIKDRSVMMRSETAQRRFTRVYEKFNKVVVGSEAMAQIFIEAFNLPRKNILRAGIPRTDLFYDKNLRAEAIQELQNRYPEFENKKVILYAPTFRDHQLDHFEMNLDLDAMQRELGDEFILLFHLHPAVTNETDFEAAYPGFVYDFSTFTNINQLLLIVDYLITDYSSIPYEFSLLNKPMLFYPYDLDQYKQQRGLWEDYESSAPGPVAYTTNEIIEHIKENKFDFKKIEDFAQTWNRYSKGKSSENFVRYLIGKRRPIKETRRAKQHALKGSD